MVGWEVFFFKNHAENEVGRLDPNIVVFLKLIFT